MTFEIYNFNKKTILYAAVEKGDPEIVKLLLSKEKIDVNAKSIWNSIFQYHFKIYNIIKFQFDFWIIFEILLILTTFQINLIC